MPLTAEEQLVRDDFNKTIGEVFHPLYEDRWDEELWQKVTVAFESRHSPEAIRNCLAKKAGWENWEDVKEHFRKGPPLFMREGWVSPCVGKPIDLSMLDDTSLEWIKGSADGWREAQVLIVEFWATWCKPCVKVFSHISEIQEAHGGRVKVVSINTENIFSDMPPVDFAAFVDARQDMRYAIAVDVAGRATEELFKPAGRLAIPSAMLITPRDHVVHYVGNPTRMNDKLTELLSA